MTPVRTPTLTCTTLLLMMTPFAFAGPSAGVDLLDDDAGCEGSWRGDSYAWYGNDSWWSASSYETTQACADDARIAAAHASKDGRSIADARVGTERGNETNGGGTASSYGGPRYAGRYEDRRDSRADHEARVVEVRSIEGDARASDGCSSTREGQSTSGYSSSSHGDGFWYENEGRTSSTSGSSTCGRSVAAQHAGESATIAQGAKCSWTQSSSSSWSRSSYGTHEWGASSGTGSCHDGVRASALGEDAAAGHETSCSTESTSSRGGTDAYSDEWSSKTSSCSDAIVLRGPEGLVLTIGETSSESRTCGAGSCHESRGGFEGLTLGSRHTGSVVVPLP